MNLDAAGRPPAYGGFGSRFYLVGYLPTYAAVLFLLVLVWAGAPGWNGRPGHRLSFSAAWSTASHLSLGEVIIIALAVALLAVVLQPLQLAMVGLAEGAWPAWLGTKWARQWQRSRRNRLERKKKLLPDPEPTPEAVQRAGEAGDELRRRFPMPEYLLRPTGLGNVLAAMTNQAGRLYGLVVPVCSRCGLSYDVGDAEVPRLVRLVRREGRLAGVDSGCPRMPGHPG